MTKSNTLFRCFNSSPEIIRLVVMMQGGYPLSLRNVEELLFERGIDWRWHVDDSAARQGRLACPSRRAVKRHGRAEEIVTDGLKSYPAAMRDLGNLDRRIMGQWKNNRAENSHLPFRRREHAMRGFRQTKTLQKLVSVHASFYNHFNSERHLIDRKTYKIRRSAALAEWQNFAA